ncbi:MAG: hypothetical protein RLZ26_801 [Pseudomonadota bacterium]|jgi:uncharacterized tellurite resistance protein B-like protein
MLGGLIERLLAPAPARLGPPDAAQALAVLLVRLARADGAYEAAEIARIDRVLGLRLGLGAPAAAALRAEAEAAEAAAPDTVRFTRALKEAVPYEERAALIEALWSVALADGERAADEDRLMRMIAPLLGVADRDSALARQRAAAAIAKGA